MDIQRRSGRVSEDAPQQEESNGSGAPICEGKLASHVTEIHKLCCNLTKVSSLTNINFCVNLLELNLHGNCLTQLYPTDFEGLVNLRSLNLSANNLRSLRGLGHLPSLLHLDVSGNRLQSLDGVSGLPRLIHLSACYNAIQSLYSLGEHAQFQSINSPYAVSNPSSPGSSTSTKNNPYSHLVVLDLRGNALATPSAIAPLSHLSSLRCLVLRDDSGDSLSTNPVCSLANYPGVITATVSQVTHLDVDPDSYISEYLPSLLPTLPFSVDKPPLLPPSPSISAPCIPKHPPLVSPAPSSVPVPCSTSSSSLTTTTLPLPLAPPSSALSTHPSAHPPVRPAPPHIPRLPLDTLESLPASFPAATTPLPLATSTSSPLLLSELLQPLPTPDLDNLIARRRGGAQPSATSSSPSTATVSVGPLPVPVASPPSSASTQTLPPQHRDRSASRKRSRPPRKETEVTDSGTGSLADRARAGSGTATVGSGGVDSGDGSGDSGDSEESSTSSPSPPSSPHVPSTLPHSHPHSRPHAHPLSPQVHCVHIRPCPCTKDAAYGKNSSWGGWDTGECTCRCVATTDAYTASSQLQDAVAERVAAHTQDAMYHRHQRMRKDATGRSSCHYPGANHYATCVHGMANSQYRMADMPCRNCQCEHCICSTVNPDITDIPTPESLNLGISNFPDSLLLRHLEQILPPATASAVATALTPLLSSISPTHPSAGGLTRDAATTSPPVGTGVDACRDMADGVIGMGGASGTGVGETSVSPEAINPLTGATIPGVITATTPAVTNTAPTADTATTRAVPSAGGGGGGGVPAGVSVGVGVSDDAAKDEKITELLRVNAALVREREEAEVEAQARRDLEEKEHEATRALLRQTQEEAASLRASLEAAQQQQTQLSVARDEALAETVEVRQRAEEEKVAYEAELRQMRVDLGDLASIITQTTQEQARATTLVQAEQQRRAQVETSLREVEEKLRKSEEECKDTRIQCDRVARELTSLQREHVEARERLLEVCEKAEEYRQTITKLNREKKTLRSHVTALEQEISDICTEKDALSLRFQRTEAELQSMRTNYATEAERRVEWEAKALQNERLRVSLQREVDSLAQEVLRGNSNVGSTNPVGSAVGGVVGSDALGAGIGGDVDKGRIWTEERASGKETLDTTTAMSVDVSVGRRKSSNVASAVGTGGGDGGGIVRRENGLLVYLTDNNLSLPPFHPASHTTLHTTPYTTAQTTTPASPQATLPPLPPSGPTPIPQGPNTVGERDMGVGYGQKTSRHATPAVDVISREHSGRNSPLGMYDFPEAGDQAVSGLTGMSRVREVLRLKDMLIDDQNKSIISLQRTLAETQTETAKLHARLRAANTTVDELKAELDARLDNLEEVSQRNIVLTQQLSDIEEQLRNTEVELSQLRDTKDAVARAATLQTELTEIRGLLATVTSERDSISNENKHLQFNITHLEQSIEHLKNNHEKSIHLIQEIARENETRFSELRQRLLQEREDWEKERGMMLSQDRERLSTLQSLQTELQQALAGRQQAETHVKEVEEEMKVLLIEVERRRRAAVKLMEELR